MVRMSIFSISNTKFFIVRHAEALKNLEKMHGGGTQDLTPNGIEGLIESVRILEERIGTRNTIVYYQREGRSEKTANIIADELGVNTKKVDDIYGVGLGVIAALNEDELKEQYPEVAKILENWKNNGAKLDDYPDVPGREHMNDFAVRILRGMGSTLQSNSNIIVVGTTSTINMMNHLLANDGLFVHDSYDFVSFPFAGINGWSLSRNDVPQKIFSNF